MTRRLRFVLWNGEEQGLLGSFDYVKSHAPELNRHVVTLTFDIPPREQIRRRRR